MRPILMIFILLIFMGLSLKCGRHFYEIEQNYVNKSIYEIQVGDTLRIYYTTNSCCQYCIANRDEFKNIEFVVDIKISKKKETCSGCSQTYAFLFVAINQGIDSICCKLITASQSCSDSVTDMDKYMVIVK